LREGRKIKRGEIDRERGERLREGREIERWDED
jgi:hypothetical protein